MSSTGYSAIQTILTQWHWKGEDQKLVELKGNMEKKEGIVNVCKKKKEKVTVGIEPTTEMKNTLYVSVCFLEHRNYYMDVPYSV